MVFEELAQIFGHAEARLCFEGPLARFGVFGGERGGTRLEVGNVVLLLEAGQLALYFGQLLTDDGQTALNEVGGAVGYAVFVINHVELVGIINFVEDIAGTFGAGIAAGEDDERAFLIELGSRKACLIHFSGEFDGEVAHKDFLVAGELVESGELLEAQFASRRLHTLAEARLNVGGGTLLERLTRFGIGTTEVVKAQTAVAEDADAELGGGSGLLCERQAEGLLLVERHEVKTLHRLHLYIEAERIYHAAHEAFAAKDEHFVLQVVAYADAVQLKQVA